MSEEVTTEVTKPRRKAAAAVKGPAVETPKPKAQIYARAKYNHKPSEGDITVLVPRLLAPLAVQAATHNRTLADGTIGIRTEQDAEGDWTVLATLELHNL